MPGRFPGTWRGTTRLPAADSAPSLRSSSSDTLRLSGMSAARTVSISGCWLSTALPASHFIWRSCSLVLPKRGASQGTPAFTKIKLSSATSTCSGSASSGFWSPGSFWAAPILTTTLRSWLAWSFWIGWRGMAGRGALRKTMRHCPKPTKSFCCPPAGQTRRGYEMHPTAVVMNMFYTGLGIARSLGEHGIPVVGLTSQRGVYGNFTRYARTVLCPDSRNQPEQLLAYLLEMGRQIGHRSVIFPTRDDDVLFLDRFRGELERHFVPMVPESSVVRACLNKWETYLCAQRAGVATPQCWLIGNMEDLWRIVPEVTYPCVLKPVAAHHWRQGGNWEIVGGRKAIGIFTREQLLAEYAAIARADRRVLLQEMISGSDDHLVIAACYLDRQSNWVAGFNTRSEEHTSELQSPMY